MNRNDKHFESDGRCWRRELEKLRLTALSGKLFPLFEWHARQKPRDCVLIIGKHHIFWYHVHLYCLYKDAPCPSFHLGDSQMKTRTIWGPLDICYPFKQGSHDYLQYCHVLLHKTRVNDVFARAEGDTKGVMRNVNRSHLLK